MGHNYGYETLMTELPTYMKQVLNFSIKDVSFRGFRLGAVIVHLVLERAAVGAALPGHVALLDLHQPRGRLAAYQTLFHAYHRAQADQRHR